MPVTLPPPLPWAAAGRHVPIRVVSQAADRSGGGADGAYVHDLDGLAAAGGGVRQVDRLGLVGRVDLQGRRLGGAAAGAREVQRVLYLQLGVRGRARGQRDQLLRLAGAPLGGQVDLLIQRDGDQR